LIVAIMFAWSVWLGFGQVITRTLMLAGHSRFYAGAAAVTTLVSVAASYSSIQRWGAVGTALSIAVPHATMIVFCALYLHHLGRQR
jgi:hypothetical protein